MREILFRGKRVDNGEWVSGSFCMDALEQYNGLCGIDGFIRLHDKAKGKMQMHEVDRETVGQFTGLTDNNGKRIFEGDVVRFGDRVGYVTYGMGCFCIHYAKGINCPAIDIVMCEFDVEVIGNIHDNPELLDGGDAG